MSLEQKLKELNAKKQAPIEPAVIDVDVPYKPMESKVPEPAVEAIRKTFSTTPEVQEVSVKETTPMFNMQEIQSQAQQMTRQPSNMDLLLGLVPLATSLIAGGKQGEGVAVAGDYYTGLAKDTKNRQQSLEDKLMDVQKARAIASSKVAAKDKLPTASNLVEVVDESGVPRYQWVSDAAGKQVAQDPKANTLEAKLEMQKRSQEFRKSQEEERQSIAAGARFQQKLEADKDFLDYKNQARNSQRALEMLSLGKGVADAGTRTIIAKGIFGDVGNIAVQEAAAVSGAPDLITKYETFKDMFNKGTRFGDTDRADLIEIATMIRNKAPGIIEKIAYKKAEAEKAISGVDVSKVAQTLSRDVTTGNVMVKVIYQGRVKEIPIEKYPEAVKKYKAKLYTGKE